MITPQPALALPPPRAADGREDFIVAPANADAVALLDGWRHWPGARLCLTGPAASGKSHLAAVWAREAGATRADGDTLSEATAPALAVHGCLVLEDADRAIAQQPAVEPALFHLMNLMTQSGGTLMLTGREAPARWGAALPDLASRLSAMAVATLAPPDDALLRAVLAKHFSDRQIKVDDRVLDYLLTRMERSFDSAAALTARLDHAALSRRGPVTRALARDVLEESGAG